jgi:MbtH protein
MDESKYLVVKNFEGQYSIWSSDRPIPPGWEPQGAARPKDECLEYIRLTWTDMAPASLKKQAAA